MSPAGAGDEQAGRFARVGFLVLAFGQGGAALWALAAPRSFFDEFPGAGAQWVSAYPPFNEHLVTDYGSGALALTVLAVMAAVSLHRRVVQAAAVAWLCFATPHFLYHLVTMERLSVPDAIGTAVSLGLAVLIPLAILASLRDRPTGRAAVAGRPSS
jgi:hypothetical protein